ncbi:UTRA domain-containing protein [Enterococcus faecium]|uniref:UTRA domain-containing protein n=1 Tax=Enterococcus faecium TaxID=1352 RepID=UPI000DE8D494
MLLSAINGNIPKGILNLTAVYTRIYTEPFFSLNTRDYYGSFYAYLKQHDIIVTNKKEIIESIHPTQEIAYFLKVSQNTPILKRTRFTSDLTNSFKEYTECFYIGKEYKYFVDFH